MARQIKMATKKLVSIPNEIATAIPLLHPKSAFFDKLGIPKLYNWNKEKLHFNAVSEHMLLSNEKFQFFELYKLKLIVYNITNNNIFSNKLQIIHYNIKYN